MEIELENFSRTLAKIEKPTNNIGNWQKRFLILLSIYLRPRGRSSLVRSGLKVVRPTFSGNVGLKISEGFAEGNAELIGKRQFVWLATTG
jgi:hypothetical protein